MPILPLFVVAVWMIVISLFPARSWADAAGVVVAALGLIPSSLTLFPAALVLLGVSALADVIAAWRASRPHRYKHCD